MYQTQQKSTENNRKVPKTYKSVTVPKITEKYKQHYSNGVKNSRKVPKTAEKYQKHYS